MMTPRQSILLELFGISSSYSYQVLKQKLIEALNGTGTVYSMQDIGKIDTFISEGLQSVPAVRVDHEKVFDLAAEDTDAAVSKIIDYIVTHKMPTVLVPIDFSEVSINAAEYATSLAHDCGFKLSLLHVHQPAIDPHSGAAVDGEIALAHKEEMAELSGKLQQKIKTDAGEPGTISYDLEWGFVQAGILAKGEESCLVVMGTHGREEPIGKLLGSIASSVAMKSHVPVLLIPPTAKYSFPEKITVAFDAPLLKRNSLDQLLEFNGPFKAHIDFVHVREKNKDMPYEKLRDELLNELMSDDDMEFSFDIHQINGGDDVTSQLDTYCSYAKPDMLVVVSQRRSLFGRLFHTSASREMCLHASLPTLVIHDK